MLDILSLNIASPSRAKAALQLDWLVQSGAHLLALTESRDTTGTADLVSGLRHAGYHIEATPVEGSERGVIIASRVRLVGQRPTAHDHRYLEVNFELSGRSVSLGCVYAPSSNPSGFLDASKLESKRLWLDTFRRSVLPGFDQRDIILAGDFNVPDPRNLPASAYEHRFEREWLDALTTEGGLIDAYDSLSASVAFSWQNHNGDRYRYDYAYVSKSLLGLARSVEYLHETRSQKISDHAAVRVRMDGNVVAEEAGLVPQTLF